MSHLVFNPENDTFKNVSSKDAVALREEGWSSLFVKRFAYMRTGSQLMIQVSKVCKDRPTTLYDDFSEDAKEVLAQCKSRSEFSTIVEIATNQYSATTFWDMPTQPGRPCKLGVFSPVPQFEEIPHTTIITVDLSDPNLSQIIQDFFDCVYEGIESVWTQTHQVERTLLHMFIRSVLITYKSEAS